MKLILFKTHQVNRALASNLKYIERLVWNSFKN